MARGRCSGVLLGQTGADDVFDAALVVLAADGDMLLPSDPDDMLELARAAGVHIDVLCV